MCGLKTIITIAALAGPAAATQALGADDQLRTFATCAGRLSAVMEYQWMFDGPASDHTRQQRGVVLDLIAAIMPPQKSNEVLHWQITAKAAQSALLARSRFNTDPDDAAWAAELAAHYTADCTSMLLS